MSPLVWNLTLDLSGLGDPASSYGTAGIALEITGARMPNHHDKAVTPLGGNVVFLGDFNALITIGLMFFFS
jgi:hypothetical protein